MKVPLFELCVTTVEAARAAESGGADRIELCSQLSVGGVTPSIDLMTQAIAALSIPVYVLIRPRTGNFVFSPAEFVRSIRAFTGPRNRFRALNTSSRMWRSSMLRAPPRRRVKHGLVRSFQISNLFRNFTVLENLYLALSEHLGRDLVTLWGYDDLS